ncbi:MAG: flagellar hook capping FlgD N-terminal domain-containing protein [Bacillota bacterium]|nr:flagellar hook capping FlgD N-terminal domain-containing protein [Bacillota bacterium]
MTVKGVLSEEQKSGLDRISKNNKNKERLKSQKLDKDSFLRLTMEQLKNQNPLNPIDNKDMIAQMAQFTSIEQMTNMVKQQTDTAKLTAMMSTQLEKLTEVMKNQNTSSTGAADHILAELRKLNEMLSQYLTNAPKDKKEADSKILSVIEG